jgi:hypothetical protein
MRWLENASSPIYFTLALDIHLVQHGFLLSFGCLSGRLRSDRRLGERKRNGCIAQEQAAFLTIKIAPLPPPPAAAAA